MTAETWNLLTKRQVGSTPAYLYGFNVGVINNAPDLLQTIKDDVKLAQQVKVDEIFDMDFIDPPKTGIRLRVGFSKDVQKTPGFQELIKLLQDEDIKYTVRADGDSYDLYVF